MDKTLTLSVHTFTVYDTDGHYLGHVERHASGWQASGRAGQFVARTARLAAERLAPRSALVPAACNAVTR